jgi:hypothetical protein
MGIYQVALTEALPGATPPEGLIHLLERNRAGLRSSSWLSVGEENKLEREAREGLVLRQRRLEEARAAQYRFFK